MKASSTASYFFAGVLLTNSVPHLMVGALGRRNLTPFGRDSSPLVNTCWGLANFACGCLLIRRTDHKTGAPANSKAWQIPYEAGCLFWSLFGVLYSFFKTRDEFRETRG